MFLTSRYNVDPFSNYSDDEIWDALEKVHMKEKVNQHVPYPVHDSMIPKCMLPRFLYTHRHTRYSDCTVK